MDYIIATHNMKKRDELQRILAPLGIRVLLAEEAGVELTDAEETGTTFEENAFIKAESGCRESGMPCIADDSGLAVDYLDGAPGVYSARYAGEHGDDDANNKKLLKALEGVDEAKRGAKFVCVAAFVLPEESSLTIPEEWRISKELSEKSGIPCERAMVVRGECKGVILTEEHGNGGFGYDPLFYYPEFGETFAEISAERKNLVSHRGNAMREFTEKIKTILQSNGEN